MQSTVTTQALREKDKRKETAREGSQSPNKTKDISKSKEKMQSLSPPKSPRRKNKNQKPRQKPKPEPPKKASPAQLKKVEEEVSLSKNRVALLKQQLQREKEGIKINRSLTKQILEKKVLASEMSSYRDKDNAEEMMKLQEQKKRNRKMRIQHEKSLQNIQKAIYLVKLDDAREIKNISMQHKKRIREMEESQIQSATEMKKKINMQHEKAKARYMQIWKEKAISQHQKNLEEVDKNFKEKSQEKKRIEEEEAKLKSQIQKYHEKNVKSKKQYFSALTVPIKEAVSQLAMKTKNSLQSDHLSLHSKSVMEMSQKSVKSDRYSLYQKKHEEYCNNFVPKVPMSSKSHIDNDKFLIILKELKRIDRQKQIEKNKPKPEPQVKKKGRYNRPKRKQEKKQ